MQDIENEILNFIDSMNRCCTGGDPNELREYFHQDVVAFTPMDGERLEGRDACISSWKVFSEYARTYSFEEYDVKIQVYENTAIVTGYYDMSYNLAGQTIYETGRNLYTFIKEEGKWWLIANQFSPVPKASPWIWKRCTSLRQNSLILKILNTFHLTFRVFPVDLMIPTRRTRISAEDRADTRS